MPVGPLLSAPCMDESTGIPVDWLLTVKDGLALWQTCEIFEHLQSH